MKWNKLLLFVPALLALSACSGGADAEAFSFATYAPAQTSELGDGLYEVKDAVGHIAQVKPGSYRRVLCIGAGALRIYSYIGDIHLLCGVEDIDNTTLESRPKMFDNVARPYQLAGAEVFNSLPSCGVGGPNAQVAEVEKILSCEPDIIISEYEDKDKADALQEQVGVPVITIRIGNASPFNGVFYQTLDLLGFVFDRASRAEELILGHYDQCRMIFDATKNMSEKKKAYVCGLGNWGTTDQFWTAQNYEAFTFAHVDNVVKGLENNGIQKIEEEKFLSLAPEMEVMIFDAAAVKNIKGKNYDFSGCKAFETGEVYLQLAYNAYYTNVETALINNWYIASVVYPERFPDFDIAAKANEITKLFNGVELYDQMKTLPQSYGGYQKIANPTEFFK